MMNFIFGVAVGVTLGVVMVLLILTIFDEKFK